MTGLFTAELLFLLMLEALAPYRQFNYQTELTPEQIGQRLDENIITGFSLYSQKPYYGSFTPYSFSVRKTSSAIKKQSLSPTVEGTYRTSNGIMQVTLNLRPHTSWWVMICLFSFPLVLFVVRAIEELFKTGDISVLISSIFPFAVLYGIFWIIFQSQSTAAIRFWEYTLQLEKRQP